MYLRLRWWVLTVSSKGCGLWYQRIVEVVTDAPPCVIKTPAPGQQPSPKRPRDDDSESEDEPRQFRRVRIRCRQQAKRQPQQAESEILTSKEQSIRCICGAASLGNNAIVEPSARPNSAWLIQCEGCHVWQHRSCVGTGNGSDPLGGFYCERCSLMFSQPSQVPQANAPGTAADLPSTPERSSTSSITPPANRPFFNIVSKKDSTYPAYGGSARGTDSALDEDHSFDEDKFVQGMNQFLQREFSDSIDHPDKEKLRKLFSASSLRRILKESNKTVKAIN